MGALSNMFLLAQHLLLRQAADALLGALEETQPHGDTS